MKKLRIQNPLQNQSGIALILELVALGIVVFAIGTAGLKYSDNQKLTTPEAQALMQVERDLSPVKYVSRTFSFYNCQSAVHCPTGATFSYPNVSNLQMYQQNLESHGWKSNTTNDASVLSLDSSAVDYIKIVNGLPVCVSIGKDEYSTISAVKVDARLDPCIDVRQAETNSLSGWGIFIPNIVPVRYVKKNYSYASSPGKLTLMYTLGNETPGSVQSSPYLEIDESKREDGFNPPTNCPVLDLSGQSGLPCTFYHVTPKGQRIYVSNQYSVGTVYLSFSMSNTLFTIRRWNENTPEEALSQKELDALVDSLKPSALDDLSSTYTRAN